MAFLRLVSSPSTSQFCTQLLPLFSQSPPLLSSPPKPPQFNTSPFFPHLFSLSLSTCPFPFSHTLPTQNQKPNKTPFLFAASSSNQYQATIETPELAESTQPLLAEEQEEKGEVENEVSQTRLLAQNVPWTSTVDDIRLLFEKYGSVVDVELATYGKGRNRGLAFVTMGSHEEALEALNGLESSEFEGRTLKLTWARLKKEKINPVVQQPKPAPIHNLFVANLPYLARAKDLKEFFNSQNGNAVSAEVIFHDNPRRSTGYGFVTFNTKEEAEAALSAFQAKLFMGRPIRVARSKKFLRQGTKAAILLESASTKSSPKSEQSEEAELA